MKFKLILLVTILLFLTSCKSKEFKNEESKKYNNDLETSRSANESSSQKEQDAFETSFKSSEDEVSNTTFTNFILYNNLLHSYSIKFPNDWAKYYYVHEFEDGSISVNFIGKSNASKNPQYNIDNFGLSLFMILAEDEMRAEKELGLIDSIVEIGSINQVKFYYATGTNSSIAPLFDAIEQNDSEDINEIKNDYNKVQDMLGDVDNILITFTEAS